MLREGIGNGGKPNGGNSRFGIGSCGKFNPGRDGNDGTGGIVGMLRASPGSEGKHDIYVVFITVDEKVDFLAKNVVTAFAAA